MALYIKDETELNNLERNQGVAVFAFDSLVAEAKRGDEGGDTYLEDGDILLLGRFPQKVIVESMIIDLNVSFPAGATLDVALAKLDKDRNVTLSPISSGIVLTNSGRIHVVLPVTANLNEDGSPYAGDNAVLKLDAARDYLAITVNGADLTVGRGRFITSYSYYEGKGTGVYLS